MYFCCQNNVEELQTFDVDRRTDPSAGGNEYVAPATPTAPPVEITSATTCDYNPPEYSQEISRIRGPGLENIANKTEPDQENRKPPPSYDFVMENKDMYKVYSKE